ncbi:MAG TPA: magnesium/cobalt transporter CorA [Balneolales bacterium]|nr:magnesium/cobalt transporter CorA [Balneolales bacterium]
MLNLKNPFNSVKKGVGGFKKPGLPPGTLVHVGREWDTPVTINLTMFDSEEYTEQVIDNVEDIPKVLDQAKRSWIHISGVHDMQILEKIGTLFGIHPLVLEDVANTTQRSKIEAYDQYLFIVVKSLTNTNPTVSVDVEQISILLMNNTIISFQESDRPLFSVIRDRLSINGSRIRNSGVDYLAYSLVDNLIDHYFSIINDFTLRIEEVEDEVLDDPTQETLHEIQHLRRELINVRKVIWPLRDTLNSLYRDESQFVSHEIKIYIRDVFDHCLHLIDMVENHREMLMSLTDSYMSGVSNRMNEVMKVLTIIATIFMPLSFIASLYGMNFDTSISPYNMPELKFYFGYPMTIGLMVLIAIAMLIYFRKKNWL